MSDGMTDAARAESIDAKCKRLDEHVERLEKRADKLDEKVDMLTTVILGLSETNRHQQTAAEHAHAQAGELLAAMRKLTATNEAITQFLLTREGGS